MVLSALSRNRFLSSLHLSAAGKVACSSVLPVSATALENILGPHWMPETISPPECYIRHIFHIHVYLGLSFVSKLCIVRD